MSSNSVLRFLSRCVSWITVEPVEFLYCLMFTTSNIVRDNLFILKVCRLDFGYSEAVCLNYTENGEVDDDVQERIQVSCCCCFSCCCCCSCCC